MLEKAKQPTTVAIQKTHLESSQRQVCRLKASREWLRKLQDVLCQQNKALNSAAEALKKEG